jgi:ribose transport system permease protein
MAKGATDLRMKLHEFDFKKIFSFIVLSVLLIFFGLASDRFFSSFNIISILVTVSINGLLAIGMTFAILSGGIDLSVGTVMAVSSTMLGYSLVNWSLPIPVALLIALATGTSFGFVSGFFIAKVKVPPFIATLGTMMIASGISILITTARPIHLVSFTGFTAIAQSSLVGMLFPGFKLPNSVLIFFTAAIIAVFVLKKTIFGRYVYAIGSNEDAVKLSGVNVNNYKILVYMTSGLFAGIAGVMMTARLGSAQPVMGSGYELSAIAAVVLGGTAMKGGEGGVVRTVIGVTIMTVLLNGMRIIGIDSTWQMVVTGIVVILAVTVDVLKKKVYTFGFLIRLIYRAYKKHIPDLS